MYKNSIKQGVTFIAGLFIMSFGVVLSVKANLGVSPISCVPYVYSVRYPLSLGQTTIIMNVFLILIQVLLLRKKYKLFQLIQLPVVFLFGFFIDLIMHFSTWIHADNYFVQAFLCLLGCVVLAIGVFLEVKAKLTYLPGEGVALAITDTFKIEFGKAKVSVDSSFVIIGLVSSFLLLKEVIGIREGTIAAAVLVGYIVKFFNGKIFFLDKWLKLSGKENIPVDETKVKESKDKIIITISREYGSGGLEIGKELAKRLKIDFYDKELIHLSSLESGFTPEYINQHEQNLTNKLWYHLYEQNYAYVNEKKTSLNTLFLLQSKVIRDIAQMGSCVIIGRCANFVLKDMSGCFNVFIHAGKEFRKTRIAEEKNISLIEAEKEIDKTDDARFTYCKEFTGKVWGDADEYHLMLDTSVLGIDKSVQLIIDALNIRKPEEVPVSTSYN